MKSTKTLMISRSYDEDFSDDDLNMLAQELTKISDKQVEIFSRNDADTLNYELIVMISDKD